MAYMPSHVTGKPNNYAPLMRRFVRNVLSRSRSQTTTYIFDIALHYLDTVRHKVPRILPQERAKQAGLQEETCLECYKAGIGATGAATAWTNVICPEGFAPPTRRAASKTPWAPLPGLPSPLLCPGRTFLASLGQN